MLIIWHRGTIRTTEGLETEAGCEAKLMFPILQILTILIVAVAMALEHVLELPGNMRLSKEDYLTVQQIIIPALRSAVPMSRSALCCFCYSCS
jgi:hypothetical protein